MKKKIFMEDSISAVDLNFLPRNLATSITEMMKMEAADILEDLQVMPVGEVAEGLVQRLSVRHQVPARIRQMILEILINHLQELQQSQDQ